MNHIHLTFGINQRHQLMHVAVSVPQREYGIAVTVGGQGLVALHLRILTAHVLKDVRMNEAVVHRRIEHTLLFFRTALHTDARQVGVPLVAGFRTELFESRAERLFLLQIQTGVLHTDEGHTDTHLDDFILGRVEREPCADIVTTHVTGIRLVKLVLAGGIVPLCLHTHRTHHLPETTFGGHFVDTHHEIDGEHRIGHIAEGTEQLGAFDFTVIDKTNGRTAFISQAFTEVHQDIALSGGEGETCETGTRSGGQLTLDAVLVELVGIITRSGKLIAIHTAVVLIVHIQFSGSRHQQQRTQFRTSHTAQVHMGETGQVLVVKLIRSGPPSLVLIDFILRRVTHHIKRSDGHHALRTQRSRIGRTIVGRTHKRIHIVHRFLLRRSRKKREQCHSRQKSQFLHRLSYLMIISSVKRKPPKLP